MDSEFFDCIDEDPMTFVHPGLQHASAPCLHEKLVQGHVFTFVRAASLKSSDGPLPRFQDVNEDWLETRRIKIYDLMDPVTRVTLSQAAVAVSHVWQTPEDPDPDGEQARIIRDFLQKHPHIELVWIDWCCLPQGVDKTEAERASFNESLEMVNLLYLGLHVTILLDSLFVGRFWTQLEAFLSYQQVGPSGLQPLPNNTSRTTVLLTGLAAQQAKQFEQILLQQWRRVSLADAIRRLRKRDAQITNRGDKDIQIQKLCNLQGHLMYIATSDE